MEKRKFKPEEIMLLEQSPWIEYVYSDKIIWKEEFKQHFIKEYIDGKGPTQIFKEAGFSKELLGSKRIDRAAANWRERYRVPVRGGNEWRNSNFNSQK